MIVLIIVYLMILSVRKTDGQSDDNLELSQARELFIWNDTDFYLYSEFVSWDEANAICEAENMHLINLDNPVKAKFISQSITVAWIAYEDMWIGAHKNENGNWIWTFTNKPIPRSSEVTKNNSFWYPPWINNEAPNQENINCLAVDRNGHSNPYFVDLSCKLHRTFICEKNSKRQNLQPLSLNVVSNEETEFILYHGRLTWVEAVSFCRQQDFTLASLENMAEVKKLATTMLKARPEIEDAWIGANLVGDQWVWIESGEEIKIIPAEYKNPNGSNHIITPQFPPWFEVESSSSRSKCAILDRHICEHPQFIAMSCDRKRNFICMRRKEDLNKQKQLPTYTVERNKKRYTLLRVPVTWDEAKSMCENLSDNSTMLNLTDIEEAKFIMKIMSDARIPIHHIWLDGKVINDEWYWVGRDERNMVQIPMDIDETGFPPWCDMTIDESIACLNLDRQNHWIPLIYGLECNATQSVICVEPVESRDKAVIYRKSLEKKDFTVLKVTKLKDTPISWMAAERACRKEIGKLWKPNLDREKSKKEVETVFNSFMAEEKKPEVELYHVEGGIYRKKENAWVYSGKSTQIETVKDPRDGDCLVARINRTAQKWEWLPVECHQEMKAQIICEPRCSLREVEYDKEESEWVCDAHGSHIFDHKMLGMGCSHRCSENRVLQGPERFHCGRKRGWVYNQNPRIHVNASKCINIPDSLYYIFADIPKDVASLIFIIDSTRGDSGYYNAAKYFLGNLVEYYKFQVTNLKVHVVSMEIDSNDGDEAVIKVQDFEPTQNCEDMKNKILLLLNDVGDGTTNYASALSKAESILERFSFPKSHIVILAQNSDGRGNFRKIALRIKQNSHVYAIGFGKQILNSQLIQLASVDHHDSFSIQFNIYSDAVAAAKGLISNHCHNCVCQNASHDLDSDTNLRVSSTPSVESE